MSDFSITVEFLAAMLSEGLEPDCQIIADGWLHRFHHRSDRPGTKNGWYVLFPDHPQAGAFGCWKRCIHRTWIGSGVKEHYLLNRKLSSIKQQVSKNYESGRKYAQEILQQAIPANGRHQYLLNKQIGAHGIFYHRGALIVPLRDINGQLHGIQRIYGDGSKRFSKGTYKTGHFHMIGIPVCNTICLAEGYATAATIHEITGHAVAVAFDVGNLRPVAMAINTVHQDTQLILCADNDRGIEGNPGIIYAQEAALSVGGQVALPSFSNLADKGTDFNDLFFSEGKDAVLQCFARIGGRYV